MTESLENRPKRKRISTAKPIPAGSSNQKKITEKVVLPEKKPVVFIKEKANVENENEASVEKTVDVEPVMMANPLPSEEKPKRTRKRAEKKEDKPVEEAIPVSVEMNETIADTTVPGKQSGEEEAPWPS